MLCVNRRACKREREERDLLMSKEKESMQERKREGRDLLMCKEKGSMQEKEREGDGFTDVQRDGEHAREREKRGRDLHV